MTIAFLLTEEGWEKVFLALIAASVVLIPIWFTKRENKETRRLAADDAALAREDARMARSAEILAATKIKEVAAAAVEVKETLAATNQSFGTKLESIAKTADDTHTLVNANMGAALNVNRISTRRLADITKDAADIEAADKAEELYLAHERKQATVDAAARNQPAGN
jgi:hypothetical protein